MSEVPLQCMAMCFFLLKQFDDVMIYLKSIKAYMFNDDDFNYNTGITKCAIGQYKVHSTLESIPASIHHEYDSSPGH